MHCAERLWQMWRQMDPYPHPFGLICAPDWPCVSPSGAITTIDCGMGALVSQSMSVLHFFHEVHTTVIISMFRGEITHRSQFQEQGIEVMKEKY